MNVAFEPRWGFFLKKKSMDGVQCPGHGTEDSKVCPLVPNLPLGHEMPECN